MIFDEFIYIFEFILVASLPIGKKKSTNLRIGNYNNSGDPQQSHYKLTKRSKTFFLY